MEGGSVEAKEVESSCRTEGANGLGIVDCGELQSCPSASPFPRVPAGPVLLLGSLHLFCC